MKKAYELDIDVRLLTQQLNDLLVSNTSEESKTGLHNLLGEILDQATEAQRCP